MGSADESTDSKQQIQIWARKIKSQKATLGNITERLEKCIDTCKKEPYSNFSQDRLKQCWNKYIEVYEVILELYNNILATDCMSKADVKSWQERYNELTGNFNTIEEQVSEQIKERPIFSRDEDSHIARPIDALKPFTLRSDHNPLLCRSWITKMESFLESSKVYQCSITVQIAFIANSIDDDICARVKSKMKAGDGAKEMLVLIKSDWCERYPLQNRRMELFRSYKHSNETMNDFLTRLRALSEEADLDNLKGDEILSYICLAGVKDKRLREFILKLDNPNLKEIQNAAIRYETLIRQEDMLDDGRHHSRRTDQRTSPTYPRERYRSKFRQQSRGKFSQSRNRFRGKSYENKGKFNNRQEQNQWNNKKHIICYKCGKEGHMKRNCRTDPNKLQCNKCRTKGYHNTVVCFKKEQNRPSRSRDKSPTPQKRTRSNSSSKSRSGSKERVKMITCNKIRGSPIVDIEISTGLNRNRKQFYFGALADTGSTTSIISYNLLKKYGIGYYISDKKESLVNASQKKMDFTGRTKLFITTKADRYPKRIDAVVSKDITDEIILGFEDMVTLGILDEKFLNQIRKIEKQHEGKKSDDSYPRETKVFEDIKGAIIDEFDDVFSDDNKHISKIKDTKMNVELYPNAKAYAVSKCRPIQKHYEKDAKIMIDDLLESGVLEKVTNPTEWCSPAHFVPKSNGKLRLVTDYTRLNKWVKRPIHPFPTATDIFQCLQPNSKYFCTLDLKNAYFQMELDEEAKNLTTFLLPYPVNGRYRYTRAPMGLKSSGDELNTRTDNIFAGIKNTQKLIDDILCEGDTVESLIKTIKEVLKRCRKYNITVSKSKFKMGTSVKFGGYIVSNKGVIPDPDKIEAIMNFQSPTDVKCVRSFLGLINQLTSYHPDIAQASTRIRELLKKDVPFIWQAEHENEFRKLKDILKTSGILQAFDKDLKTILLTDASKLNGLGWALIQMKSDGSISLIKCGSSSLTPAQKNYAVIELEMLAIHTAIRKCDYYLRGLQGFEVHTDHRPLIGIFKKDIREIDNVRLARMREKLMSYKFDVEYVPGKSHIIADTLSRYPIWQGQENDDPCYRCNKIFTRHEEDPLIKELIKYAEIDQEYEETKHLIRTGSDNKKMPNDHHTRKIPKDAWDNLSIEANDKLIVLNGYRIFIPKSARKWIMKNIHISHAGIAKSRMMANQRYYWPGLNQDIKQMCENCQTCMIFSAKPATEPCVKQDLDITEAQPMDKCGSDLFSYGKNKYVILVDSYSGYVWCQQLRNESTVEVWRYLSNWFNLFGYPKVLKTDDGPCYRGKFTDYCQKYGIKHEVSSAYNPASNGLSESGVKSAKSLLKKCEESNENFEEALFQLRNTPRIDSKFSPNQLFFKRNVRDNLPSLNSNTKIEDSDQKDAERRKQKERMKYLSRYDHNKTLDELKKHDKVWMYDMKSEKYNIPCTINEVREKGKSYYVIDRQNNSYLRNRKYLKRRTDNRDIETKPEHKNEYKDKQETDKTYPRYNLRNKSKRVTFNPIIEYKY